MIFIIIPVHNRKELTRNCLRSLNKQTFKEFEVIIVDDGSTDGTYKMITSEFPEIHIINGDGNLWWAGATNEGVNYVLANWNTSNVDYILTLNNDLVVPEKYLEVLFNHAAVNKRSILGSVSIDILAQDRMNFCGISWNELTSRHHMKAKDFKYSYKELISQKQFMDSDMLPGRGTLIPIKVFKELGLYDAIRFPQYAADEDFTLRAKRNGWNLIIPVEAYVMSHIDKTGVDVENVRLSVRHFKHLFFSIKSPLNIRIRYRWAIKNTKLKIFYFILDCSRIMLSTFLKILKGSFLFCY